MHNAEECLNKTHSLQLPDTIILTVKSICRKVETSRKMLKLISKAVFLITFVWCVHVHGTFKGKYTIRVHFVPPLIQGYCQIAKFWNPRNIECALCFCLTGRISRCIPRPGCILRNPSTTIRPTFSTTAIPTSSDNLNNQNPSTLAPNIPTAPPTPAPNPIESTPTAQVSTMGAEVETTSPAAEGLMIPESTVSVLNQQLDISMTTASLPGNQLPSEETSTSSPGETAVAESSSVVTSAEESSVTEIVINPANAEEMSMPNDVEASTQHEENPSNQNEENGSTQLDETTMNPDESLTNPPDEVSTDLNEMSKPSDESSMDQGPESATGESEGLMNSEVSPLASSPNESPGEDERYKHVTLILYNKTNFSEKFHATKMSNRHYSKQTTKK